MPDFTASGQSHTGMNKNADTGSSSVPEQGKPVSYRIDPVPELDAGCRNTDVGGIGLDADAQL
jgi:hypothetical protein